MNVLLVEPDKILGKLVSAAFEVLGWHVTWQRTAQKALDYLEQRLPDLIILEIQTGVHGGVEFLYELRSYREWQNIPVVIYSINRVVQDPMFAEALQQLGVQKVLYKPTCNIAKLCATVKNL